MIDELFYKDGVPYWKGSQSLEPEEFAYQRQGSIFLAENYPALFKMQVDCVCSSRTRFGKELQNKFLVKFDPISRNNSLYFSMAIIEVPNFGPLWVLIEVEL